MNYKNRSVLLTVYKLSEHYLWQNLLKVYDKTDLSVQMWIIYSARNRYAIRFKFGKKFLTFPTKLVLEVKASISSTVKENLPFYCRNFLAIVVVIVIIYHKENNAHYGKY